MKTFKKFIRSFIVVIFTTSFLSMKAQEIPINVAFSSDTTFNPFNGEHGLYSFKMTGGVNLLSDSSLIRVVLIDVHGNHYLIYEAYPLIDTSYNFSIQDVCDETCYLDNITPDSIRVDIINAIVSIDQFTYDLTQIYNVHNLQEQAKWVNDSVKISILNQIIQQDTMFWRAGRNNLTQYSFNEKEKFFNRKYSLEGYDCYKGGIYKRLSERHHYQSQSTIVEEFDWRARHGANIAGSPYFNANPNASGWITKPDPQGMCNSCYAFSAVAAVEAYVNLYFNNNTGNTNPQTKHQINVDLSEGEAIRCQSPTNTYDCYDLGYASYVLDYIKTSGISNIECFPWNYISQNPLVSSQLCSAKCSPPDETIKVYNHMDIGGLILGDETRLKRYLIKYGPLTVQIPEYWGPSTNSHSMLLVGYFLPDYGDIVYQGNGPDDPPIILSNIIPWYVSGSTVWIFKDSYLNDFIYEQFGIGSFSNYECNIVYDQIDRFHPPLTTTIKCSDEDGDGYYWWGIHWYRDNGDWTQVDPKLCECPPGVNVKEEDCDDNNVNSGPYDQDDPQNNNYLGTYNCIQNNCIKSSTNIEINGPTSVITWDTDRHINQDIIIEPSYTLSVTAEIFFAPGARIFVRPGGKLVVAGRIQNSKQYNARLTSACNQLWGGVELGGDPTLIQDENNQGSIFIDHGFIENATCGIKTLNSGKDPDWPGGGGPVPIINGVPTGGIIKASNATFRNNIIGVEFYPYKWFNGQTAVSNNSILSACTFKTDSPLLNGTNPEYLLKLDGVNKIPIINCTFENINYTNNPDYFSRGSGIFTYNSELYINFENINSPTEFDNLKYGIYGMCSGLGLSSATITNTNFYGNKIGAYFSGYSDVTTFKIKNCNFQINNNFGSDNDTLYCLYLNTSSGYTVSENSFDARNPAVTLPQNIFGVIVNNSGARSNNIYHNNFYDLAYALQGENVNHGIYYFDKILPHPVNLETGLCFKCNNFYNCKNDIIVNDYPEGPPDGSGILTEQGYDDGISDVDNDQFEPARNKFSVWTEGHSDVVMDNEVNSTVTNIIYYYPQNYSSYNLKPQYIVHPEKVTLIEHSSSNANYNINTSCPEFDYPIDNETLLRSYIVEAKTKIDSLLTLLNQRVDDGSTEEKNSLVINSVPSQSTEVYTDLINTSPYLSDTVLKSSISKEEVLNNAMITDILTSNPQSAKNDNILNMLDNRSIPLSDTMWNEIMEGTDTVAELERLEGQLLAWIRIKEVCFDNLVRLYFADSTLAHPGDSIISWLRYDSVLSSQYILVNYFISHREYDAADSILDIIPDQYNLNIEQISTNQRYKTLLPLLEQLLIDTLGYIKPDSNQYSILQDLATNDKDLPGTFARNMLIYDTLLRYSEPVIIGDYYKSSKRYHKSSASLISSSQYNLYPNPCQNFIVIEDNKNDKANLIITLANTEGKNLMNEMMILRNHHVFIPLKGYSPGVYFMRISEQGQKQESHKIIISR